MVCGNLRIDEHRTAVLLHNSFSLYPLKRGHIVYPRLAFKAYVVTLGLLSITIVVCCDTFIPH